MQTNQLKISVVICTFNRADLLAEALAYLGKQDFPKEQFEMIVIDNASSDHTAKIAANFTRSFPDLNFRYIFEKQPGLSNARNRGLIEARGDYVAFIDDDGLAAPEWLTELTLTFESYQADAVGGAVFLDFRAKPPYWLTRRFHGWLSIYHPTQPVPYEIDAPPYPVGCNFAFRRSVLVELGGFNPALGRYGNKLLAGEETAVFCQAIQSGKSLFIAPKAVVRHIVAADRMTRRYFLKIQRGLIKSRISRYQSLKPGRRFLLAFRLFLEIVSNGIILLLSFFTVRFWFLAYLFFYRSLLKLAAVLK